MRTREGNKERDILQAAIQAFAQGGYHNAKISKIAEVAGIAIGSVYLYFRNKEDILYKIFDNIWQQLSQQLQNVVNRSDMNPVEKLDNMIDMVFDIFTSNPSLAIVFVNEQNQLIQDGKGDFVLYFEKFLDMGEQVLNEGIEKHLFNPNQDVKILRLFVFGGLHHLIHQWAQFPDQFPLNHIRQEVKFFIKHGILKS